MVDQTWISPSFEPEIKRELSLENFIQLTDFLCARQILSILPLETCKCSGTYLLIKTVFKKIIGLWKG